MRKRVLSFVLVFALFLSLSSVAYAATGPYTYLIPYPSKGSRSESVSTSDVLHAFGVDDFISYAYNRKVYHFDQSQFVAAHLDGLMPEYRGWGLKETLIVDADSQTLRIPSEYEDGWYAVKYTYIFGYGSWYVKLDGTTTYSGTFTDAPREYDVDIFKKS